MTDIIDSSAKCYRLTGKAVWHDRLEEDICPRCGSSTGSVKEEPEFCAMYAAQLSDLEETEDAR